jgi:hypothetical protein
MTDTPGLRAAWEFAATGDHPVPLLLGIGSAAAPSLER